MSDPATSALLLNGRDRCNKAHNFQGFGPGTMRIELDNLSRPEVHALLRGHMLSMLELSPPVGN